MYDSARKLVISGLQNGNQQLTAPQLLRQLFLRMYAGDFTVVERERIIKRIPNLQMDADT
jgi:hypothetical protein